MFGQACHQSFAKVITHHSLRFTALNQNIRIVLLRESSLKIGPEVLPKFQPIFRLQGSIPFGGNESFGVWSLWHLIPTEPPQPDDLEFSKPELAILVARVSLMRAPISHDGMVSNTSFSSEGCGPAMW